MANFRNFLKAFLLLLIITQVCHAQSQITVGKTSKVVQQLHLQLKQNHYSAVLLQAETLKNQNPQNLEVRELLFEVYLLSNLLQKAESELQFIEARRKNSLVSFNRGRLAIKKGNLAESERIALAIVSSNIHFSKAYLLLKDIALKKQSIETANAYLQTYQEIEGRDELFLQNKIDLELQRASSPNVHITEKEKINNKIVLLLSELGTLFEKDETYYFLLARQLANSKNMQAALKAANMAISFNSFSRKLRMMKAEILFNSHAYNPLINHLKKMLEEEDGLVQTSQQKKENLTLQGFLHFIKNKVNGSDWEVSDKKTLTNTTIPTLLNALNIEPEDERLRFFIEQLAIHNLPLNHSLRTKLADYPQEKALVALKLGQSTEAKDWFLRALLLNPQDAALRINYKKYLMEKKIYGAAEVESEIIDELSNGEYLKNYKNSVNFELLKKENAKSEIKKKRISVGKISAEIKNKIILAYKHLNWADYFSNPYADIILRDMLASRLSTSWLSTVETVEENRLEYALARTNPQYFITYSASTPTTEHIGLNITMVEKKSRSQILADKILFSGNDRYFQITREFKNKITSALPLRGKVIHKNGFRLLISLGHTHGLDAKKKYEAAITLTNPSTLGNTSSPDILGPFKVTKTEEMLSQIEVKNFFQLPKIKLGMEVIVKEIKNL